MLVPVKYFESGKPDSTAWGDKIRYKYPSRQSDDKIQRFCGVTFNWNPTDKADVATMERITEWLTGYSQFFEGEYEVISNVVRFDRTSDAETFWLHCVKSKLLFSGERDVFIG